MKLKLFLIIIGIIFLLLGTNIASAGIWDDFLKLFSDEKTIEDITNNDVFKELILNDASKTEAIITIKNPMETIGISRNNIKVNFTEECGKVAVDKNGNKKYKLLINDTCIGLKEKEKIYGIKLVCYNTSQIEEICELNCSNSTVKEICYNQTYVKDIIYEHYSYFCFKEFAKINAKDLRNIKIVVDTNDIVWGKCSNGFGYKIDWQLEIVLDDGIDRKILTKSEWAWWNESYPIKFPLNCTFMDDKVPLVINGSSGFEIDGKKQIVWTYCDGIGTALYLHNSTDWSAYVIANDTTELPRECESCNASSYLPTQVWDSNFKAVWLMNNANTTAINDSTSNNIFGTKTSAGNPAEVDGKIGKAQDFSGGYIDATGLTTNATQTISMYAYADTQPDYSYLFDAFEGRITLHWSNLETGKMGIYDGTSLVGIGTIPSTGYWHSIVYELNAGTVTLYVNNTQLGSPESYTSRNIGGTIRISGTNEAGGLFDGSIDHFTVSNIIRSSSFRNQSYQNILGTSGYGNLLAEESAPYLMGGIVKDSNNVVVDNAKVIIINQATNTIIGITTSNSTGGWEYNVTIGTYLVVAYDPNNSTRDGDADPHIIVS